MIDYGLFRKFVQVLFIVSNSPVSFTERYDWYHSINFAIWFIKLIINYAFHDTKSHGWVMLCLQKFSWQNNQKSTNKLSP